MADSYTVLIPQDIPDTGKKFLEEYGCRIRMGSGATEADLIRDIADVDAVVARTAPYTRAVLEAGKKLKIVSRFGVGVDNIELAAASELGIWVTNTPEANSATVAEHALAMMLAFATDLVDACSEARKGNFAYRDRVMGVDLGGKTLSIIGLGRIGRRLAHMTGVGLGMRVLGCDPFWDQSQPISGVAAAAEWDQAFREADFISLHLPLTPNTRGCVGHKEFALMKKTACLVNCARGEVLREDDLIAALQNKEIAGAALDVFEKEPPDAANPLFRMPNVVVTPHCASFTRGSMDRMGEHMAQNIRDVMAGREPAWPVARPKA